MSEFEPGTPVEVRYPRNEEEARGDRDAWPWLPGVIEEQAGDDEWSVVVEFAVLDDGTPAPDDADDGQISYPVCFRDASEIRTVAG